MHAAAFVFLQIRPGGRGEGSLFRGRDKSEHFAWSDIDHSSGNSDLLRFKGILLLLVVGLVSVGIGRYVDRRLGGITGDVLGAICETVEVTGLAAILLLGRIS